MIEPVRVAFYIPENQWPEDIDRDNPVYCWSSNRFGKWNWTLQTYQHLKDAGVECSVTTSIDWKGILIAHRAVLPDDHRPGPTQLLVCILAERVRHPHAHFHILQNPRQAEIFSRTLTGRIDRLLLGQTSRYIRYWPQPGLIPRDPAHGDRFLNIVFMGVPESLTPALASEKFSTDLSALGMHWKVVHEKALWPDYSDVDAVLAIREPGKTSEDRKPATKLYNAWIAGVPAILSRESAFQYEGEPGSDYLEANTADEALQCLKILQSNPDRRRAMIETGRKKCGEFDVKTLTGTWSEMIQKELKPLFIKWSAANHWQRRGIFRVHRRIQWMLRTLRKKLHHRLNLPFNPFR